MSRANSTNPYLFKKALFLLIPVFIIQKSLSQVKQSLGKDKVNSSLITKYPENQRVKSDTLLRAKLLAEIILYSGTPIRIKGDTILYTADCFKVGQDANTESLLKKLPSVTVNKNGQIMVAGQRVTKVLVDGEEFFGNKPGTSTKFIDAAAVKEIEIYETQSDQDAFSKVKNESEGKTINIRLKENHKNAQAGKFTAESNAAELYHLGGNYLSFKGKRKIAAFADIENTGEPSPYGDDELVDEKYPGSSPNDIFEIPYDDYEDVYAPGSSVHLSAGGHFNDVISGGKTKVTGAYKASKSNNQLNQQIISSIYLGDSVLRINNIGNKEEEELKQGLTAKIETKVDPFNIIQFTNTLSLGESNQIGQNEILFSHGETQPYSTVNVSSDAESKSTYFNSTALWRHTFKKQGRTFSLQANYYLDILNAQMYLNSIQHDNSLPPAQTKVLQDERNSFESNSNGKSINLVYTEPLNKEISVNIMYCLKEENGTAARATFEKTNTGKYENKIDSLSNEFYFRHRINRPGAQFSFMKGGHRITAGSAISFDSYTQKSISGDAGRSFSTINFAPNASVSIKIKQKQLLQLQYHGASMSPSQENIQPFTNNTDRLNIHSGNRDLRPAFVHNITATYRGYKKKSTNGIWINTNASMTRNAFIQDNSFINGINHYRVVNANGNRSLNFGTGYSFLIPLGDINCSAGMVYTNYRSAYIFNGKAYFNEQEIIGLQGSASMDYGDNNLVAVNSSVNKVKYASGQDLNTESEFLQLTLSAETEINFFRFCRILSEISMETQEEQEMFQSNQLIFWDAKIIKELFNDKLQVFASAKNLLNSNNGYSREINTFQYTERIYTQQKRYFMIGFNWNFKRTDTSAK